MNKVLTLYETGQLVRDMEVEFTTRMRDFEAKTGCHIKGIKMETFSDVRFIVTTGVLLGRNTKEEREEE